MSKMEKNRPIIEEIKDIYHYLTEGEPNPDDEIEAQKELTEKFEKLKEYNEFPDKKSLIEEIIAKLKEWDTLEYWFIETPLPKKIDELLQIKKEEQTEESELELEEKSRKKSEVDISEIMSQLSEQFKGEIDTLREEIDSLKNEIKNKEDIIQTIKSKKQVKKITPKKEGTSKLPPLEIHLPAVKKAEEKIMKEAGISEKQVQRGEDQSSIESVENELLDRETKLQKKQEQYKEKLEVSLQQLKASKKEQTEEREEFIEVQDEVILEKPIEKPETESFKEVEMETTQKSLEEHLVEENLSETEEYKIKKPELKESELSPTSKEKQEIQEQELTTIPTNEVWEEENVVTPPPTKPTVSTTPPTPPRKTIPSKPAQTSEKSFSEQEHHIPQNIEQEDMPKTLPPKKPTISTMAVEEPVNKELKQMPEKPPKMKSIAEVEVEETEMPSQEPLKTDLFSVFSSMGKKNESKPKEKPNLESIKSFIPGGIEEKNVEKPPVEPPKKDITPEPPEEDYSEEIESKSIEELPKDKDALYQELIALEGKRYSLEKSFKELEKRYNKGSIDEHEFKSEGEKLKDSLNEITRRITNIRRIVASM
ncbi:MAG: hypothetical protein ACQERB_09770 [Promethearchaeati archaeon]